MPTTTRTAKTATQPRRRLEMLATAGVDVGPDARLDAVLDVGADAPTAEVNATRPWLLYLLECRGGKLYAGISPDVEARFAAHCAGSGAKYTRANPPLRILAAERHDSRSAATVAEHGLKRLSRAQKLLWASARPWPALTAPPAEPDAKLPPRSRRRSAAKAASSE